MTDRQTDRRTDGNAPASTALCMATGEPCGRAVITQLCSLGDDDDDDDAQICKARPE